MKGGERVAMAAGLLLAVAGAGPAAGQDISWTTSAAPAWLGFGYEVEWLARDGNCSPRVVVESVVQGAPADRAGLRPGDAVVLVNGRPVAGRLQVIGSPLSVGDSVRLRVFRDGRERDILAIAGRRPDRPPVALSVRGRDGLYASGIPVIRVVEDTLVARNLETLGVRRGAAYWLAYEDGRTEYRRIAGFSEDPMDRRVTDLLICAQRTLAAAPAPPTATRVDLRQIQERADSLRVVMTERAMSRPEAGVIRPGHIRGVEVAPAPPAPGAGMHVYTFRVEDHIAAGERGVAGAEVTPLDPELAEYFRGAREGLLVLRVAPGTPADRAGLRPGDVLTSGRGRSLTTVADLRLLLTIPDPTPVELQLVRHGRTRSITIRRD